MRTFAQHLGRAQEQAAETLGQLRTHYAALSETWQDPEFDQVAERVQELLRWTESFGERATVQATLLSSKADALDGYLECGEGGPGERTLPEFVLGRVAGGLKRIVREAWDVMEPYAASAHRPNPDRPNAHRPVVTKATDRYVAPVLGQLGLTVRDVEVDESGPMKFFSFRMDVAGGSPATTYVAVPEERWVDAEAALARLKNARSPVERLQAARDVYFLGAGASDFTAQNWSDFCDRLWGEDSKNWQDKAANGIVEPLQAETEAFSLRSRLEVDPGLTPQEVADIHDALGQAEAFLRRTIRGPLLASLKGVDKISLGRAGRACYDPKEQRIYMYRYRDKGQVRSVDGMAATLVHEFGHHIQNGPWGAAARDAIESWFSERVTHSTGRWEYRGDEGYRDHFYSDYVGRDYPNRVGTEVLSMGLQALFEHKSKFMFHDPDHYALVMGLVKGAL